MNVGSRGKAAEGEWAENHNKGKRGNILLEKTGATLLLRFI